jgi:hypothetical protein
MVAFCLSHLTQCRKLTALRLSLKRQLSRHWPEPENSGQCIEKTVLTGLIVDSGQGLVPAERNQNIIDSR